MSKEESTTVTTELSSSPPPSSPSAEQNENPKTDETAASSSPDRRPLETIEEQPVIISQEYLPLVTQTVENLAPRRVKVYKLRGDVWVDLGTGFCQGYIENVRRLWGADSL
jgi:hypothetical protein